MIGERDSAATDAAELARLHQEAARRRAELSATVATAADLISGGDRRAYAARTLRLAARAAWQAARRAARSAVAHRHRSPPGGSGQGRPRGPVPAAAVGAACVLAVALTWRARHTTATRAARPRARRGAG